MPPIKLRWKPRRTIVDAPVFAYLGYNFVLAVLSRYWTTFRKLFAWCHKLLTSGFCKATSGEDKSRGCAGWLSWTWLAVWVPKTHDFISILPPRLLCLFASSQCGRCSNQSAGTESWGARMFCLYRSFFNSNSGSYNIYSSCSETLWWIWGTSALVYFGLQPFPITPKMSSTAMK